MKGYWAWNRQWYSLEGVDTNPLPSPYPEILYPESLSAWREQDAMGLIQAQIDGVEPPSNSQQGNEDISEGLTERFSRWMNSMGEWTEAELIADLPRQTWIPAALLDEWPITRPNRGIITDDESITDLVTLFKSVCGPLNGEILGWQRVPDLDMAQLFALPMSIVKGLQSNATRWNLHSASALWTLYWLETFRNTETKGRQLAVVRGDRDFGLWIFEGLRLIHQGRYLWNTATDILYHALARRSEQSPNCIHFLQTMNWSAEQRSILDLSFDHVHGHDGLKQDTDVASALNPVRQGLVHALQQWNLKFG
ncbi:MAG: hypothetical protein KGQ39_00345 [Bacteroidetes bacterium]|nr:hypothetical protein [Bacteroidota bacterium]